MERNTARMFEKPHMTLAEQLQLLLTGKMVFIDTDFKDCGAYTLGCFENELHIDTADGHRFLLTISQIEDTEE